MFRYGPPKDDAKFNQGLNHLLEAMAQLHYDLSKKLTSMVPGASFDFPHP
jgi:hypothetical protein